MNRRKTVLYVGVTRNLIKRMYEHKNKLVKGFSNKYNLDRLVYFEEYVEVKEAIRREKQLKNWKRRWKEELIEKKNPEYRNLCNDLV